MSLRAFLPDRDALDSASDSPPSTSSWTRDGRIAEVAAMKWCTLQRWSKFLNASCRWLTVRTNTTPWWGHIQSRTARALWPQPAFCGWLLLQLAGLRAHTSSRQSLDDTCNKDRKSKRTSGVAGFYTNPPIAGSLAERQNLQ